MDPANRAKLEQEVGRDEGRRRRLYYDTRGIPTLGVGHNLLTPISERAVDVIFDDDLDVVIAALDAHWPFWRTLNDVRQRVIANMVFNLGIDGFLKFKRTRKAIEDGRYADAAEDMWASLWARQVGDGPGGKEDRADRLTAMMATGEE